MSNLNSPPTNLTDFEILPASDYIKMLEAYCTNHDRALEEMQKRLKLKPSSRKYPDPSEQLAFEIWHMRMHDDMNSLRAVITAMHN